MKKLINVRILALIALVNFWSICLAEDFPVKQTQETIPMMAQYYSGCKSLNIYIKTQKAEYLEDALFKMNPKRLEVENFVPDSIIDSSGICDPSGHFVYDYTYALAIYEEREIPKELDFQRGTDECKVSLIALKPLSSIIYTIQASDYMEMLTICEPNSVVTLKVKECSTGNIHIGKLYDNDTVCHTSWTMDNDIIEITITNNSDHITTLAFLTN